MLFVLDWVEQTNVQSCYGASVQISWESTQESGAYAKQESTAEI